MPPIRAEPKLIDPEEMRELEWRIEMREKFAASGGLPFQVVSEGAGIDGEKDKVLLSCEMLVERSRDLVRGRKVDEPVAKIVGRTPEATDSRRFFKRRPAHDLVDCGGHGSAARLAARLLPNKRCGKPLLGDEFSDPVASQMALDLVLVLGHEVMRDEHGLEEVNGEVELAALHSDAGHGL
jgi:hypothetical protein